MFTVAETFAIALSLPSTFAAQAAHVIPCTRSSTRTSPDDSPDPENRPLLTAADDMQRHIPAIPLVGKRATEYHLGWETVTATLLLPGQRCRAARAAPENIHTPERRGKATEKQRQAQR
jgi:hypothetical protein